MELQPLASIPLEELLAAAAVAALLLLVLAVRRAGAVGRRLRAQSIRAAWGEDRAETLLQGAGWGIEGRQVSQRYDLAVDGAKVSVLMRADFIVRRRGRRYVAEVKTGKLAPRIETSSTRRQLLEYRVAFGVDGVLLVDAESSRISLVEFPLGGVVTRGRSPLWWAITLGLLSIAASLLHGPWGK